jgi:hypothetical protein
LEIQIFEKSSNLILNKNPLMKMYMTDAILLSFNKTEETFQLMIRLSYIDLLNGVKSRFQNLI